MNFISVFIGHLWRSKKLKLSSEGKRLTIMPFFNGSTVMIVTVMKNILSGNSAELVENVTMHDCYTFAMAATLINIVKK